jgi:hypothetical protein
MQVCSLNLTFPDNLVIQNFGKELLVPTKKKTEPAAEETTTVPPSDETDVADALARDTQDGKGDESVPPSDFESFATTDVQAENKSVDQLADEILRGNWGDYTVLRDRLIDAGHDDKAVITRVNERMTRGAPSAYRPSAIQVADQIQRGEWGDNHKALESRLLGAGYKAVDVFDILRSAQKS